VLIAPADSKVAVKIKKGVDLGPALGPQGKLATGDPDSVPVGKYAKTALEKLGVWDKVSGQIVRAKMYVRRLAFVARGEAPLVLSIRPMPWLRRRCASWLSFLKTLIRGSPIRSL